MTETSPSSPDEERAVLNALFLDPTKIDTIANKLAPEDFFDAKLRTIYAAILDLYREGAQIDYVTVLSALKHKGSNGRSIDRQYLTDLSESFPHAESIEDHSQLIRNAAERRKLLTATQKATRELSQNTLSFPAICQNLQSTIDQCTPPDSARAERDQWPSPLHSAAFHGLAGQVIRLIAPHTEADPVALLVQFLVALGNVIGRGPHFVAEASHHFTNLYTVIVGKSARGRKGSSWAQILRFFELVDSTWTGSRVMSNLSSGEGLIHAVRDDEEKDVQDKRLLDVETEFGQVLKVFAREGNTLSPILRQAFDTGTLRTLTRNDPLLATNVHFSLIAHITLVELRRNLSGTELSNGMANRIIWICAQRSKCLPEGGGAYDLTTLQSELEKTVQFARKLGTKEIPFDGDAREAWHKVYQSLTADHVGVVGEIIARSDPIVRRIATIYAVLDQSEVIRLAHLKAALAVWEYAEASAKYIFGGKVEDRDADRLLRALRTNEQGMTRTEIRDFFGRNKTANEINRILSALSEQDLARKEKPAGSRKAERWFAK